MAEVKIIQTITHDITTPVDFTPPSDYAKMIGGTFAQINPGSHISGMPSQPCRVRVASPKNLGFRRKLINEFNFLQSKINNFEYFLRPLCIAEDMQSLMYSSFQINPPKYKILCTDILTKEQKWVVTKQVLEVVSYLQTKELVLEKLEESDFEILFKKGNDIRVKVHLLNTQEMDTSRLQKSILNVGLALMRINWPYNAQNIESKLRHTSEIRLSEVAAVFNQVSMTSNEYLLVSMLLTMILLPKGKRPEWNAILQHPYFWTPLYKNEFILTLCPPGVNINTTTDPFKQWQQINKMKDLVDLNSNHSDSYGPSDINNCKNLIKLYRDKYQHRDEIIQKHPDQCMSLFGTKKLEDDVYLRFFETRFPTLLMWLWHVARKNNMTKEIGLSQFYPRPNYFVKEIRDMLSM